MGTDLQEKELINPSELPGTHKKVLELTTKDVRTKDQAAILGIHPNSVSRVKHDLKKYAIAYDKKLLKKSKKVCHKIVDDFMLDKETVKPADALKVVEMQQSRIDPVVNVNHNKNMNLNMTIPPAMSEDEWKKYQE